MLAPCERCLDEGRKKLSIYYDEDLDIFLCKYHRLAPEILPRTSGSRTALEAFAKLAVSVLLGNWSIRGSFPACKSEQMEAPAIEEDICGCVPGKHASAISNKKKRRRCPDNSDA